MNSRSSLLASNVATLESARRRQRLRSFARDRTLQRLVIDLVAARTAVGMTQEEVPARMSTTKSAVSRLESGRGTRPTLRTIQNYALAVGARVEIRVRAARPA